MSNYCAHYDFAMWPLLQVLDTLLLGTTTRLQQYNRLVLAVSCEIEPLLRQKREQTLDIFCGQVAYNVANFDSYCTTVQIFASLVSIFLQLLLFLVDMVQ